MASLQGFQEVSLAAPVSKSVMTVTDSVVRFNKATAEELGYPAYVHVLVNESAKQIAIQACADKDENTVKFSKPADKQEDEIDYRSIPGVGQPDDKAIIFTVADAKAGTMKKRGRKKAADAE